MLLFDWYQSWVLLNSSWIGCTSYETIPPVQLEIDHRHGGATTRRPSPAARRWWWWWIGLYKHVCYCVSVATWLVHRRRSTLPLCLSRRRTWQQAVSAVHSSSHHSHFRRSLRNRPSIMDPAFQLRISTWCRAADQQPLLALLTLGSFTARWLKWTELQFWTRTGSIRSAQTELACSESTQLQIRSNVTLIMVDRQQPGYNLLNMW